MRQRDSDLHRCQRLLDWLQLIPPAVRVVLIVIIYVLAGLLLNRFASEFESSWQITPWYPPSGLHVALLLGSGLRYAPALLLIPLLDGLVLNPQDLPPLAVLLCSLFIMLGYSIASAWLLKHQFDPSLARFRDLLQLVVSGALIASGFVALCCVTTQALAGIVPWSRWETSVLSYWAGNATGVVMLAPLLLLLRTIVSAEPFSARPHLIQEVKSFWSWSRGAFEGMVQGSTIVIASWFAYDVAHRSNLDYSYLTFAPLLAIAVRHGFMRTVLGVLLLNYCVVLFAQANLQSYSDALAMQFDLMTVSTISLLLGGFVSELRVRAARDSLTGLCNRAEFAEKLEQAAAKAYRSKNTLFAVLLLDLDCFKVVNDSLGHEVGDQLLVAIANQLRRCLRATDVIARLGGDEFTILLEKLDGDAQAINVAQRLNDELAQTFSLKGYEVFTTVSIGIATSSISYRQPGDLLRDADIALYRAKAQGKSRCVVFDQAMYEDIITQRNLENDLRQSVDQLVSTEPCQQFQLYYQPIVSLLNGRINGFEALIRWQHPQRGLVGPAEFIKTAEETGLIVPLGTWIFRQACKQLRVWQRLFPHHLPLKIAINLSGRQLNQPNLVEQIAQLLREYELEADGIRMEITENILMENVEEASLIFEQLKALGIELNIDDFGIGYSSLYRLSSLPVTALKVDRYFVSTMEIEQKNIEVIKGIIELAHSLNLEVTAEGVETAAQLALLRELHCDEGQGYFFSRPLPGQAAQELLATSP